MAEATKASTPAPVVLPDVVTEAHPVAHAAPSGQDNGGEGLQGVLPAIAEAANKVGGYKKLAEIADTLDQMSE